MKVGTVIMATAALLSGCAVLDFMKQTRSESTPEALGDMERQHASVTLSQVADVKSAYGGRPYVLCYGRACDEPTPKTPVNFGVPKPRPVTHFDVPREPRAVPILMPALPQPDPAPAIKIDSATAAEQRIHDSVGYRFNKAEITADGEAAVARLLIASKQAREVLIDGYAGVTDRDKPRQKKILELALARAKDTAERLRAGGMGGVISTQARVEYCRTERDCMKRHKQGGRRADVEVVIIPDGAKK